MLTEQELNLLIEVLNRAGATRVEKYAVAMILNKLLDAIKQPKQPPKPKEEPS